MSVLLSPKTDVFAMLSLDADCTVPYPESDVNLSTSGCVEHSEMADWGKRYPMNEGSSAAFLGIPGVRPGLVPLCNLEGGSDNTLAAARELHGSSLLLHQYMKAGNCVKLSADPAEGMELDISISILDPRFESGSPCSSAAPC